MNHIQADSRIPDSAKSQRALNPGAGDPISRIMRAEKEIAHRRLRRSEFREKAVLMDSDQVDGSPQRRKEAEALAREFGINIIWQEPCHEALLLRHLKGHAGKRPPTSKVASDALNAAWPEYVKPMTKVLIARRIGLAEIERVANVEASLATFLRQITLLA